MAATRAISSRSSFIAIASRLSTRNRPIRTRIVFVKYHVRSILLCHREDSVNNSATRHIEPLEPRRLLAIIGLDVTFGGGFGFMRGPFGSTDAIVPVAGGKFLVAGGGG